MPADVALPQLWTFFEQPLTGDRQRADERHQGERRFERRGHVADAQLDRAELGARANVPVDVFHRLDGAALAHHAKIRAEILPPGKIAGDAGMRQRAVKRRAARSQPRVDPLPEGGTGRDRQQVRQIPHELIHHAQRHVAVRQADVDVQPEHHPLMDQVRETIDQAVIALGGGDRAVGRAVKRMRARHRQLITHRAGDVAHPPQTRHELLAHFRNVLADARLQLDHRLHQLGGDAVDRFIRAGFEQADRAGRQVARIGIEQHQLELRADRGRRGGTEDHLFRLVGRRSLIALTYAHGRRSRCRGSSLVSPSWIIGGS